MILFIPLSYPNEGLLGAIAKEGVSRSIESNRVVLRLRPRFLCRGGATSGPPCIFANRTCGERLLLLRYVAEAVTEYSVICSGLELRRDMVDIDCITDYTINTHVHKY